MVHTSEQIEPVEISRGTLPERGIPETVAAAVVIGAGEFMLFLGFVAAVLVLGGERGREFPAAVLVLSTVRTGLMHLRGFPFRFRSPGEQAGGGGRNIRGVIYGRWIMILVMLLLLIAIDPENILK